MRKFQYMFAFAATLAVCMLPTLGYAAGERAPDEMTGIKVGDKAPDFTLSDQNGKEHSLGSLLEQDGTTVLVFFRSANW